MTLYELFTGQRWPKGLDDMQPHKIATDDGTGNPGTISARWGIDGDETGGTEDGATLVVRDHHGRNVEAQLSPDRLSALIAALTAIRDGSR